MGHAALSEIRQRTLRAFRLLITNIFPAHDVSGICGFDFHHHFLCRSSAGKWSRFAADRRRYLTEPLARLASVAVDSQPCHWCRGRETDIRAAILLIGRPASSATSPSRRIFGSFAQQRRQSITTCTDTGVRSARTSVPPSGTDLPPGSSPATRRRSIICFARAVGCVRRVGT